MGALGTSISTATLVKEVQGRDLRQVLTVNPVSPDDCHKLCQALMNKLDEVPSWLLGEEVVVAASGANSLFRLCCTVLGSRSEPVRIVTSFTTDEAKDALQRCAEKTDAELFELVNFANADRPDVIVPKLALLVAVLEKTKIQRVDTVQVIGSCAGVLRSKLASFWPLHTL